MRYRVLPLLVLVMWSVAALGADINGDGYEIVLLPLAFTPSGDEVAGAHGTIWTGSVWVHNGSDVEIVLHHCGGVECSGFQPGDIGIPPIDGTHPELGYLFYPLAVHAPHLTFSNRIFERTRYGQPRGVNIPVVREGDFFSGERVFPAVPVRGGVRAGIRIYDPWVRGARPPALTSVTIEVLDDEKRVLGNATVVPEIVYPEGSSRPGFAAIHDLAAIAPEISTLDFVHVRVTPAPADAQYYAMVAVTDNDTQTVSIITAD